MPETKALKKKTRFQLVSEFPDFNSDWEEEKKLAWFDDFIQLLNSLDFQSKEKSG